MRNVLIFIFLFISLNSCVEKYWPELDKYDSVLVVDGLLTNGSDTTVIYLSSSSSVNNGGLVPLGGTIVYC